MVSPLPKLTDLKVYDEVPLNAKATDLAWAKVGEAIRAFLVFFWRRVSVLSCSSSINSLERLR